MSAEAEVLRDVIGRLENAGFAYMITGSVAMAYYAEPRMTRDLDIVVELDAQRKGAIVPLFSPDYYVSEEAVAAALRDNGMFNLFHFQNLVKVDLIVRKPHEYRLHEFSRRRRVRVGDADAWLVSKEDLILSKLAWLKESGSELQMRDIKNLLASGADENYLSGWAPKLGVEDLLEECRGA